MIKDARLRESCLVDAESHLPCEVFERVIYPHGLAHILRGTWPRQVEDGLWRSRTTTRAALSRGIARSQSDDSGDWNQQRVESPRTRTPKRTHRFGSSPPGGRMRERKTRGEPCTSFRYFESLSNSTPPFSALHLLAVLSGAVFITAHWLEQIAERVCNVWGRSQVSCRLATQRVSKYCIPGMAE